MIRILCKNIGILFAIILMLFSCGKKDSLVTTPQQLTLHVASTEITAGEEVTFSVMVQGQSIDAAIYIEHKKITGTSYLFDKPGSYVIVAKKQGYKNSDYVKITVLAKKQLYLSASAIDVMQGDTVTFTVRLQNHFIDADIFVDHKKISDSSYVFEKAGTYSVFAQKEGYHNSDTLEIKVNVKKKLVLKASATEIAAGNEVTFEVSLPGQSVNANIFVNHTKILGYTYVFDKPGTYAVIAKAKGYRNSDSIEITVNEAEKRTVVYVAGYDGVVPKYWKNGIATALPSSTGAYYSRPTAIAVNNKNVYVAGYEYNGGQTVAKYWENGTAATLTGQNDTVEATAIAIDQNNVYIAGHNGYFAQYWKNGTPVELTNGTYTANATDIAINQGDIYVAGYEYNGTKVVAKYWKNGAPVVLSDGTHNVFAAALAIYNGNVYVAGRAYNGTNWVAKYWKNTKAVTLTQGNSDAVAVAIAVDGGNVYVAGYVDNGTNKVAKYWKNGTPTALTDGNNNAKATAIAVFNGDLYVAGAAYNGTNWVAKYWKNGVPILLTDGKNYAITTSIFVTEE